MRFPCMEIKMCRREPARERRVTGEMSNVVIGGNARNLKAPSTESDQNLFPPQPLLWCVSHVMGSGAFL